MDISTLTPDKQVKRKRQIARLGQLAFLCDTLKDTKKLVYRIINNCNKYPNCGTMYLSQRGGKHNATQSK